MIRDVYNKATMCRIYTTGVAGLRLRPVPTASGMPPELTECV